MIYQTEQQMENKLIANLVENKYEQMPIPDVDALQANFRKQMNRMNKGNFTSSYSTRSNGMKTISK